MANETIYNRPNSLSTILYREREQLSRLLEENGVQSLGSTRIRKLHQRDGLLPSFEQERLIFLQQFDPDSWRYNMAYVVRLTGELDVVALEEALNGVVRRHEALRTTFRMVDGSTVQVIAEPSKQT